MMRSNRAVLATGAAVLALTGVGAIAAASTRSDSAPPRYRAEIPVDATPAQREAVQAMMTDSPIPVIDDQGKVRGFVRDSALTTRDDRVTARILAEFREPTGPVDDEYDRLYEALRTLDPVHVIDEDGKTVGYWTHDFMSFEEHRKLAPQALATVSRMLRN